MPAEIKLTELELLRLLLKRDKRNTMQIHRDTGLGYFWLRNVRNGTIKNPGFEKARQLLVHLSSK